jgi:hypothetical protein
MTDHHHPGPQRPEPPTARQQRYLRALAQRTRQTFAVPRTKAEASAEIRRLQGVTAAIFSDRRADDRQVGRDFSTGTAASPRIREDETTTTGYGTTARWA